MAKVKTKNLRNYGGAAAVAVRAKGRVAAPPVEISLSSPLVLAAVFSATIFTSASLLFMVQPMVAKMMLPLLGGAPAVWTTCMLFFQFVLLLGYGYAHLTGTRLSFKAQVAVQGALLAAAAAFLPIAIPRLGMVEGDTSRILVVFVLLALAVGLPFFVLSSSAPLLQKWFSRTNHPVAKDPYFLYAASNLGSMLVLLAYPTVIEPNLGLVFQSRFWAAGYALLIACYGACAYLVFRNPAEAADGAEGEDSDTEAERPTLKQRVSWVALAFVPSSLMLGVTTYFTTDIATIPLLWIMPLALYLATYILVFARVPQFIHQALVAVMPVLVIGLLVHILARVSWSTTATLMFHLTTFFVVTMVFHGEIARTRPSPRYLTEFYLLMSLGGVLGGMFNGVVAPVVFNTAAEYPIALVLACVLLPGFYLGARQVRKPIREIAIDVACAAAVGGLTAWLVLKWPLFKMGIENYDVHRNLNAILPAVLAAGLMFFRRPIRMGLSVAAFTLATLQCAQMAQDIIHQDRSFFGILKVSNDLGGQFRTLINGTTLHGRQALHPELRRMPLTYYHQEGPVGSVFQEFQGSDRVQDYAVIGLGTGTLAAYARPGQKLTYYEIDEAVVKVATNHFTYLADSQGDWKLVMGDARLRLQEAADQSYGLILVDAFSSDAIPVHLLTQEAIQLYFKKLAPRGMVAIHTSNRYLSLEPILGVLAKDARLTARVMRDPGDDSVGKMASTWVVLTRDEGSLGRLAENKRWDRLEGFLWTPTWTDDFTSVLPILK